MYFVEKKKSFEPKNIVDMYNLELIRPCHVQIEPIDMFVVRSYRNWNVINSTSERNYLILSFLEYFNIGSFGKQNI